MYMGKDKMSYSHSYYARTKLFQEMKQIMELNSDLLERSAESRICLNDYMNVCRFINYTLIGILSRKTIALLAISYLVINLSRLHNIIEL